MTHPISSLCGQNHDWIERTLELCVNRYVGADGLLITALSSDGAIVDPTPLIADFGDVLPFLAHFGRRDFVERQIKAARPHLSNSLFRNRGRIRLFDNHDWLLGLLELHELTGDASLLALARDGAFTLIKTMFIDDFLVDGTIEWRDARTWLRPASPFNGGYIELWLELYAATGDPGFVQASRRLAARWIETEDFRETGIFHRVPCSYSSAASRLAGYATTSRARLFKDNTNFVWGLLSLWQATAEERWRHAITDWLRGFRSLFLNEGDVFLWLGRQRDGHDVSLKAAFSSIDLLCDLYLGGVQEGALELAFAIARRWVTHQWANGLFPETPDGERDHLDANVDMAIALLKLGGVSGRSDYVEQARKTANAVIRYHSSPLGLVQAVGKDGQVRDSRIIVKYQGLALKLALAPESPAALLSNPALLKLLRDR
ncbi:hypothetical protein IVB45_07880 [Bradyrhizobium sp. 4]|uniref:hypothetical protein n=1 Tax=unclassified Bradyrhizobium TaxID=2631580 RepID=UPI001FFAE0D6|nr:MULTISPECIES: hypothetical protein [unclassified Bradyrhizobium]MCK1397434.1 hypothetical protein [Bradyrhizobium sp. 39]MCK1752527.1 hypothetical protein [Bradyrhizobium sp. 135]UPJ36746.1 hypothetical protein IVB45_07880 [Bradyrhizobium sp. 4]